MLVRGAFIKRLRSVNQNWIGGEADFNLSHPNLEISAFGDLQLSDFEFFIMVLDQVKIMKEHF